MFINAANTVLLCTIGIKWQFASQAVCAYSYDFKKQAGFALVGACALIRTNMVMYFSSSKNIVNYNVHTCTSTSLRICNTQESSKVSIQFVIPVISICRCGCHLKFKNKRIKYVLNYTKYLVIHTNSNTMYVIIIIRHKQKIAVFPVTRQTEFLRRPSSFYCQ